MLDKLVQSNVKGRRICFLMIPYSATYMGEIPGGVHMQGQDQDIFDKLIPLIRAHGFGVADMIPYCRAFGMSYMPFYYENNHYVSQGHPWLGRIAAQVYYEEIKRMESK
jgi:hypothetical protein